MSRKSDEVREAFLNARLHEIEQALWDEDVSESRLELLKQERESVRLELSEIRLRLYMQGQHGNSSV